MEAATEAINCLAKEGKISKISLTYDPKYDSEVIDKFKKKDIVILTDNDFK